MKLLLRVPLLLAMVWLALEAVVAYACRFMEGYPLWPLIGLGASFWAYTRLRPEDRAPRPVVYDRQSLESVLFLLLAIVGAAVVLNVRGEKAFEPLWYLHLAVLTFSLLLIPYLVGRPFVAARSWLTALSALFLLGLLLKGEAMGCCSIAQMIRSGTTRAHVLPQPPPEPPYRNGQSQTAQR